LVISAEEPTVNVKFCLAFPREAVSVPVMRRVLGDTLRNLGVEDECVRDILVAVTEACTNVLRHGGSARRYEVVTSVGASGCVVEVLDSGEGFGPRRTGAGKTGAGTAGAGAARREAPGGSPADRRPGEPGALAGRGGHAADRQAEYGRARRRARSPGQEHIARRAPVGGAGRSCGAAAQRRIDDQIIARLPESGRGLQIMRALVDDVTLQSGPGLGTVVSMRKRVSWRRDAPLTGLSDTILRDAG
jgi:anti-sigma regulatory factor (Ser/Thr protein kinase)